jgi:Tol biopolymer transport system component
MSPDRSRVAVIKTDLQAESADLWILDVATGKATRITTSKPRENARAVVWSPDGSQVAYIALRDGAEAVYRRASNGEGPEELLYKHPGAGLNQTDWSMDGRYLSLFSSNLAGGTVWVLPTEGKGERKPIEVLKSDSQVQGPRLSPDGRFMSYMSNVSGKNEVYVRPVNLSGGAAPAGGPWQVSDQGGLGMAFWRRDGKEFFYLAPDRAVMSVEVSTTPTFEAGKPKVLFRPPDTLQFNVGVANVSRDGQRVLIAVPPAQQLQQITVFDRQGKVLSKVGEPGLYAQPHLSPDGTRVVAMRNDLKTGQSDIWSFDVATGKAMAVTNDNDPENAPVWSSDGKQVAYASTRKSFSGIYKKAWDGSGNEEQLFQYTPGAGVVLTDWSPDGRFMTFHTGALELVSLAGDQKPLERKAIDWLRDEYIELQGRFSPDMRYMAYLSDEAEAEKFEVYVRPFDASKPEKAPDGPVVRVSKEGSVGMISWRRDGKEMYFVQTDPNLTDMLVMAVDVTATPAFQAGTPKLLFKLTGPLPGNSTQWKSVSADGQKFVFAINVPVK